MKETGVPSSLIAISPLECNVNEKEEEEKKAEEMGNEERDDDEQSEEDEKICQWWIRLLDFKMQPKTSIGLG